MEFFVVVILSILFWCSRTVGSLEVDLVRLRLMAGGGSFLVKVLAVGVLMKWLMFFFGMSRSYSSVNEQGSLDEFKLFLPLKNDSFCITFSFRACSLCTTLIKNLFYLSTLTRYVGLL